MKKLARTLSSILTFMLVFVMITGNISLVVAQTMNDEPVVDTSELELYYNDYKDTERSIFYPTSWNEFQDALNKAGEILNQTEGITKEEVDEAVIALKSAHYNLKLKPETSDLESTYNEYAGLNEKGYTPESWSNFQNALQNAYHILYESEDATDEDVSKAGQKLQDAVFDLVWKPDVDDLRKKYNEYKDIKRGNYTYGSWNYFQDALELAHYTLSEGYVDQDSIDWAYEYLVTSHGMLEKHNGVKPDVSKLSSKYNLYKALKKGKNNSEIWDYFQLILERTYTILNDDYVTQEEVDSALQILEDAYDGLQDKGESTNVTPPPSNPSKQPAKKDENVKESKQENKKVLNEEKNKVREVIEVTTNKLLPNTATDHYNTIVLGALFIVEGIVLYVYFRLLSIVRRQFNF